MRSTTGPVSIQESGNFQFSAVFGSAADLNLFAELPTGDEDVASDDTGFGAGLDWSGTNRVRYLYELNGVELEEPPPIAWTDGEEGAAPPEDETPAYTPVSLPGGETRTAANPQAISLPTISSASERAVSSRGSWCRCRRATSRSWMTS